jgi:hypothetical protein
MIKIRDKNVRKDVAPYVIAAVRGRAAEAYVNMLHANWSNDQAGWDEARKNFEFYQHQLDTWIKVK